jgi:Arc/MetJ-type ribon-helix-helix transcriptional regulator
MSIIEKNKYQMVSIGSMNTQVNVRLPTTLLRNAERYAKNNGYSSVQEVMREALRETVMLSADDLRAIREAKEDERRGRTVRLV